MAQRGRRKADEALLLALACGATIESAARQVGVGETTVYRRLREESFCQRLDELRSEMVERASSMLTAAAMESVKTLLELQKKDNPAAVRLGAARSVLELGLKLRDAVDLKRRVAELQEQFSQSQGC